MAKKRLRYAKPPSWQCQIAPKRAGNLSSDTFVHFVGMREIAWQGFEPGVQMHCKTATERKEWSFEGWEDLVQEALANGKSARSACHRLKKRSPSPSKQPGKLAWKSFLRASKAICVVRRRSKSGRKALRERVTLAFERFAKARLDWRTSILACF